MKKIGIKISSFLLAILVVFSTLSFSVEKHFCGDFLVDTSYFGDANDCKSGVIVDSCDEIIVLKSKKCCKDEVNELKGQDELQNSKDDKLSFHQQAFLLAFSFSYEFLFKELPKLNVSHQSYVPPNLVVDFQVLHEVFII